PASSLPGGFVVLMRMYSESNVTASAVSESQSGACAAGPAWADAAGGVDTATRAARHQRCTRMLLWSLGWLLTPVGPKSAGGGRRNMRLGYDGEKKGPPRPA